MRDKPQKTKKRLQESKGPAISGGAGLGAKGTFQGEEPLDTGGGRVFFSLDASSGFLATRRRLGRGVGGGGSSALRSAFLV